MELSKTKYFRRAAAKDLFTTNHKVISSMCLHREPGIVKDVALLMLLRLRKSKDSDKKIIAAEVMRSTGVSTLSDIAEFSMPEAAKVYSRCPDLVNSFELNQGRLFQP